jgi:hypothetical protein
VWLSYCSCLSGQEISAHPLKAGLAQPFGVMAKEGGLQAKPRRSYRRAHTIGGV